jgi:hypothetical protein
VDHLVVVAASLEEGAAWCARTLGATPGPGGAHPLMGTHNLLCDLSSPAFPRAYLEILAVDPGAPRPARARWFDLDRPALAEALRGGPRLVHFAARTDDAEAALAALAARGIDRGPLIAASRGGLTWRISVRDDGQRLFDGALPTLIAWGDAHPCDSLPRCELALDALRVVHPRAAELADAYRAIGLGGVPVAAGAPSVIATIRTAAGSIALESAGA